MKTLNSILTLGLLILCNHVNGQNFNSKHIGTYTDGFGDFVITELQLKNDGTFKLITPDPIFPYTFESYENYGSWISKGDTIVLNPDKEARIKEINFSEKQLNATDSITIKINYSVKYFDKDVFLTQKVFDFDLLTICLNKERNYYNLVRQLKRRRCAFAPRVKKQVLIDSTNTIRVPSQNLSKIGVFTYGFDTTEWLDISNRQSNHIEIDIVQPIDNERTPRQRMVIVKGNRAFYYMRNGKIDKNSTPLIKKKQN